MLERPRCSTRPAPPLLLLLKVKNGTVRWTNEGTVLHTVVSDSGFFGSGPLTPKAWYEVRFDSVGAFPYHCNIHAGMLGTVVVDP